MLYKYQERQNKLVYNAQLNDFDSFMSCAAMVPNLVGMIISTQSVGQLSVTSPSSPASDPGDV